MAHFRHCCARAQRQLRSSAAKCSDLRTRQTLIQEKQRPAVTIERRQLHCGAGGLIVGVKHRPWSAKERVGAAEVVHRGIVEPGKSQPRAPLERVCSLSECRGVGDFPAVVNRAGVAHLRPAAIEGALHTDGRHRVVARAREVRSQVLEPRFVHRLHAENRGLRQLQRLFGVALTVGARSEAVAADAFVLLADARELVAAHESIGSVELIVNARTEVGARLWRNDALIDGLWIQIRVERGGVDEGVLVDVPAFEVEAVGRLVRLDRTADVGAEELILIVGPSRLLQQRAARIQVLVVELIEKLAPNLVRAWFGQNLDAAEARPVVLRRIWIRVDSHFPDGRLRWQAAAREAVNEDLSAIGAGRGPCECLQLLREFIRIVRQRGQFLFAQNHGGAVRSRVNGDAIGFVLDVEHLRVHLDRQLGIQRERAADLNVLALLHGESRRNKAHGVLTGGQTVQHVLPGFIRRRATLSARSDRLYQSIGDQRARGVGYRAAQAGRGRLREQTHSEREKREIPHVSVLFSFAMAAATASSFRRDPSCRRPFPCRARLPDQRERRCPQPVSTSSAGSFRRCRRP